MNEINLITELRALIGQPPAGYEFLEYLIAGFVLIFLVYSGVSVISAIIHWVSGGGRK